MKGSVRAGILLVLFGFALVFTGVVMSRGEADFGGLVMIGPIPLVFGTSSGITLVTMLIGLLVMFVYYMIGEEMSNMNMAIRRIQPDQRKKCQKLKAAVLY